MIYKEFQGLQLSALGMGTIRLPLNSKDNGDLNLSMVDQMVDAAIEQGVNYFDLGWDYHNFRAETVVSQSLLRYPRDSYYLATKFPGYYPDKLDKVEEIFEEQLRHCGVEYFDFYLLHNVCEGNIDAYLDPKYGIIDYLLKQKESGRIRHFGFSTHGEVENIGAFLDAAGQHMEFCQIQLNWLDWTLQSAKEKYELLTQRNIPVWVMEPVRGGRLAILPNANERTLKELRPEDSIAKWSFRFLQSLPNVHMVLSGMSNMEQMQDNVATFNVHDPVTQKEFDLLLTIAEDLKAEIPCTGCQYCCDGCPKGINIPGMLAMYNELRFAWNISDAQRLEFLKEGMDPAACIFCNSCVKACPQHIKVPEVMLDFSKKLPTLSGWDEVCKTNKGKA